MKRWLFAAATCALAFQIGCGSASEPSPRTVPAIEVLRGTITDTANARRDSLLVVRVVNGDGQPVSGAEVTLDLWPSDSLILNYSYPSPQLVVPRGRSTDGFTWTVLSDSGGRVAAGLRFGGRAGQLRVAVRVPVLQLADTVPYQVVPATAFGIRPNRDTTLRINGTARLRAEVIDSYGNARGDAVTFTAGAAGLTVSLDGKIAGSQYGVFSVHVRSGPFEDSSRVAVVPTGRLAAVGAFPTGSGTYLVDIDGAGLRQLKEGAGQWLGDGTLMLLRNYALYHVTVDGVEQQIVPQDSLIEMIALDPNRRSVFFATRRADGTRVYRLEPDGSNFFPVCRLDTQYILGSISPSRDQLTLAFSGNIDGVRRIGMLDVSSGCTPTLWNMDASSPRWGPDATTLLSMDLGNLRAFITTPDGTIHSVIDGFTSGGGYTWSPEGQWIVGRAADWLEVINLQTGMHLPLYWSGQQGRSFYSADWWTP